MQWSIHLTVGHDINYIWAYQFQTQIFIWGNSIPVDLDSTDQYTSGWAANNKKYTLRLTNAKYENSGNYSVECQFRLSKGDTKTETETVKDTVTVEIQGMVMIYIF